MNIVSRSRLSSRRDFLASLGAGSTMAALLATLPANTYAASKPASAAAAQKWRTSKDPETGILWMSATKLAQLIREKKVSSTEVVKAHIERIQKVNPLLNAVVTMCFERALEEAAAADKALAAGRIAGPLHGVPMTIKDSLDTEGVITTGGTIGRMRFVPEKDATTVARCRAAGAILLGKTNTPEFTLGGGGISGVSSTANIIFGISRNPYNQDYSTSGSSGGAGAIVAAGGAAFDLGTDYGGSIRGPANANGIAGIKPTSGRVPRTGHIVDYGGWADAFQQVGPLARRVEDLALIMEVISGPDFVDAAIVPAPLGDPDAVDLKKLRVAWYADGKGANKPDPEVAETVTACVKFLEELGVASLKEDLPPMVKEASEARQKLSRGDQRSGIQRLLEKSGSKVASSTFRFDDPPISSAEFLENIEILDSARSAMLSWIGGYDVVVCPLTAQRVPEINRGPQGGGWGGGGAYSSLYNTTGWPAGIVRAGTDKNGLPIGIHVVGQPWAEDKVIAVLNYIESRTGGWKKPAI
jgi:amidase